MTGRDAAKSAVPPAARGPPPPAPVDAVRTHSLPTDPIQHNTPNMVEPTYPHPPNRDRMSDEAIDEWYRDRLPEAEQQKFEFVVSAIDDAGRDHDEDTIVTVMNHFHTDPNDPVDVAAVLDDVGVPVPDATPEQFNVDPTEVNR